MTEADIPKLSALLTRVFDGLTHGKSVPSQAAVALWFDVLAPWPLERITQAMTAHLRLPSTGRTLPIPADIVAQLRDLASNDGRPGAEEAWSIAKAATNEAETVVWSEEIAQSWQIAQPIHEGGDQIGARMAFREAYERLVGEARADGRPVAWSASLGLDESRRAQALQRAEAAGRIAIGNAAADVLALPAPGATPTLLLAGPAAATGCPERLRERLDAAKQRLLARTREAYESPDVRAKRRTAELRAEAAELAAPHLSAAPAAPARALDPIAEKA